MTDKEFEALNEKVHNALDGEIFPGCLATEDLLKELTGLDVRCYDQYIDDGCDDEEEDDYVMCAAYQLSNREVYIHIYYGDNTGEIGCIDISEA